MSENEGRGIIARIDSGFKKELEDIKLERVKDGLDLKLRSDKRLTKAMTKLSMWKEIKRKISEADFEDE